MANKENLPPRLAPSPISKISPSNKPALGRQRDHSACRVTDTPLKVKKTRENLKQASVYGDIPPPCLHVPYAHDDQRFCAGPEYSEYSSTDNSIQNTLFSTQGRAQQSFEQQMIPPLHAETKTQRQKSVSRRMLSKVKQGLANRSKSSQRMRPDDSDTSLVRRWSGRRNASEDKERRSQSFELSRDSIDGCIDETSGLSGSTMPAVQRSITDSTVSTSEILEDLASVEVPYFRQQSSRYGTESGLSTVGSSSPAQPSTPSPQPTPRPFKKTVGRGAHTQENKSILAVPCVDLKVTVDCTSVDVNAKRDVWVAVEATIRTKSSKMSSLPSIIGVDYRKDLPRVPYDNSVSSDVLEATGERTKDGDYACGLITNMRLCYKPTDGSRIRNIIGQRTYKDLVVGQKCVLFIKVTLPKIGAPEPSSDPDPDALFAELESIVGTLETDILHVEARYRHSILPSDNIVAVKHTCKILRPKTESRWSIIGLYEQEEANGAVHAGLAQYLAEHYAAEDAQTLLHRYFDSTTLAQPGVKAIYEALADKIYIQRLEREDQQPEVVITDIDLDLGATSGTLTEHFSTAPCTPSEAGTPAKLTASSTKRTSSTTALQPPTLAPPRISSAGLATFDRPSVEPQDTARRVWQHIRRTSLSAKQLEDMTPERLSNLEEEDERIGELRRKALANKRSIGAETLRAWKWEGSVGAGERMGEAPWM